MELIKGKRYRLEFSKDAGVDPINIIANEKTSEVVAGLWKDWRLPNDHIKQGHAPYLFNPKITNGAFLKFNLERIVEL